MRAGLQRHLEDLQIGHRLRQRRARAAMHDRLDAPLRARLRGQHLHQFLILVMDRHRQPGLRDLAERREHRRVIDAREPHRVILVGGQLERRDAARRQTGNCTDAAGLGDGAIQRHVDMRGTLHPADLVGQDRRIGHRSRHVVRHVHAGGDATRRRALRRGLDARPTGGRRSVHVAIDQSGQDQLAGMVDGLARRRRRPLADRGDRLAAHRDVAARMMVSLVTTSPMITRSNGADTIYKCPWHSVAMRCA